SLVHLGAGDYPRLHAAPSPFFSHSLLLGRGAFFRGGQLTFALNRFDTSNLALGLVDLARSLQTFRSRLEAQMKEVLQLLTQRELQLLIGHTTIFSRFHDPSSLSRRLPFIRSVAGPPAGSGKASCKPPGRGCRAPPFPANRQFQTESCPA